MKYKLSETNIKSKLSEGYSYPKQVWSPNLLTSTQTKENLLSEGCPYPLSFAGYQEVWDPVATFISDDLVFQGTWFFGRTLCRVLPACQVATWIAFQWKPTFLSPKFSQQNYFLHHNIIIIISLEISIPSHNIVYFATSILMAFLAAKLQYTLPHLETIQSNPSVHL